MNKANISFINLKVIPLTIVDDNFCVFYFDLVPLSISRFPGGPDILSGIKPASFNERRTAPLAQ